MWKKRLYTLNDDIEMHQLAWPCNSIYTIRGAQTRLRPVLAEYTAAIASNSCNGAILCAVCRGKVCEGVDLTDRQCRIVMVVGVGPLVSLNSSNTCLFSFSTDTLSNVQG